MSSSDQVAGGKKESAGAGREIHRGGEEDHTRGQVQCESRQGLPVGTLVTDDFRPNRVRIFVDTIAKMPRIS